MSSLLRCQEPVPALARQHTSTYLPFHSMAIAHLRFMPMSFPLQACLMPMLSLHMLRAIAFLVCCRDILLSMRARPKFDAFFHSRQVGTIDTLTVARRAV